MRPKKEHPDISPERSINAEVKPTPPSKGVKRERPTSSSPGFEPTTPAKSIKRSRSASPPPKPSSKATPRSSQAIPSRATKKAKTQKSPSQKAAESATKAAKAEASKAEKALKEASKQGKQDWKTWINDPANKKPNINFHRTPNDDLLNVKESAAVYGIKREELNCLPHCNAANPHGAKFTPMKLFKKAKVQDLAFRKEAILAGVAQDDEMELLRRGRKLFEMTHGPTDNLWTSKMGDASPSQDRKPDSSTISGFHKRLIGELKAGLLFDDTAMDAMDELDEAGLRHMVPW